MIDLREQLGAEWFDLLDPLFNEPWMKQLGRRLATVQWLRPSMEQVFQAYKLTQPSAIKVLIIGQDPYPHKHANGLAFSSTEPTLTMTLKIVSEELERTGYGKLTSGDLTPWAEQGVMLLNSVLTCEQGNSLAHKGWGWERFVGETLRHISNRFQPIVVMCWGKHATSVVTQYLDWDKKNFHVLTACHPVAETWSNGRVKFVGCNHFKLCNEFLGACGSGLIDWTGNHSQLELMGLLRAKTTTK